MKWMTRATLVGLAVLALAACSSSGTKEVSKKADDATKSSVVSGGATSTTASGKGKAAGSIQIVGKGFSAIQPEYGDPVVSYGALLKNPSNDRAAASVSLNLAFYDAAGVVVKAETPTLAAILPGQQAAVGDDFQGSGVVRMEVQALVGRWEAVTTTGAFTASNVSTTPQSYGGLQTTATLTSTFAKDLQQVKAAALYFDGAHNVVGGAYTYLNFVPANGQAAAEITSSYSVPNVANTEVFAELSTLTVLGAQ